MHDLFLVQSCSFYMHVLVIKCNELTQPENGIITYSNSTLLGELVIGSIATYSCNTEFVLVGQTTRLCENTNRESDFSVPTGTWTGNAPTCKNVFCSKTSQLF